MGTGAMHRGWRRAALTRQRGFPELYREKEGKQVVTFKMYGKVREGVNSPSPPGVEAQPLQVPSTLFGEV